MTPFLAGFGASLIGVGFYKLTESEFVPWPKVISVIVIVIGVVCAWLAYN